MGTRPASARATVGFAVCLASVGLATGPGCLLDASGVPGASVGPSSGGGGGGGTGNQGAGAAGATGAVGGTGEAGSGAAGGSGGSGGGPPGLPTSCAAVAPGSPSAPYTIDPTGGAADDAFDVYCDMVAEGGGWALVVNSIGAEGGSTPTFWQIPYADRLLPKGTLGVDQNYYDGRLYALGTEFRDEIEDLDGTALSILRVSVQGFDTTTMNFEDPQPLEPPAPLDATTNAVLFNHFRGWSAPGNDFDTSPTNCSEGYMNITQHYGSCWIYNLGTTEPAGPDNGWGPHVLRTPAVALGLTPDPGIGVATRVSRISRWARW